ncbi:hypothetical protein [Jeongeupia chitinilytica]|uniref:Uncharacterized protein n=1 Tax=Jeongeupia chitinilytica TaxID=1041641 RepID=A0ABQ3H445_9NEIS|nr:hypothetical protein [Jeongeupia chitinilytica]GHD67171.1 hypothetical protein GCM10007350_30500 [Jeongeupia chitinilytica]
MDTDSEKGSWWKTLPGVLSGVAAVIAAVGGLVAVLSQSGFFAERKAAPAVPAQAEVQPPPAVRSAAVPVPERTDPTPDAGADQLLRRLAQANIRNSVGEATMRTWLADSDWYRLLARESLAVVGDRRLRRDGADLDKISFFYVSSLGFKSENELPAGHAINRGKLTQAIVDAYNDSNGAGAKALQELLE